MESDGSSGEDGKGGRGLVGGRAREREDERGWS